MLLHTLQKPHKAEDDATDELFPPTREPEHAERMQTGDGENIDLTIVHVNQIARNPLPPPPPPPPPSVLARSAHQSRDVRFGRECKQSTSNIFLICHILWHFQDDHHWPLEFHVGQKLKHTPISLKVVSNCLFCHKDSKNVGLLFNASPMLSF